MKNEIKEILDRLEKIDHKDCIAFEFADSATFDEVARCFEERKKMADYITNLQEENEKLIILKEKYQLKKEVYKSRNEKAIEYIKQNSKCGGSFINDKFVIEYIDEIFNGMELLNILNGGDE